MGGNSAREKLSRGGVSSCMSARLCTRGWHSQAVYRSSPDARNQTSLPTDISRHLISILGMIFLGLPLDLPLD